MHFNHLLVVSLAGLLFSGQVYAGGCTIPRCSKTPKKPRLCAGINSAGDYESVWGTCVKKGSWGHTYMHESSGARAREEEGRVYIRGTHFCLVGGELEGLEDGVASIGPNDLSRLLLELPEESRGAVNGREA